MSEQADEDFPAGAVAGRRGVLRNFGTLALGEGAARLLGFVAVALLARRLGPGGFGLITLGISLVGWYALVVDAGTETLNIREVSRTPHRFRELADPVLGMRLALSVLAAGAFVLGGFAFSNSAHDRSVLLLFAIVLPAIALNLRWMTLGIRGAKAIAAGNVISRLVFVLGVLAFVSTDDDVYDVPLLEAAAELGYALVIIAVVSRRFGIPRPRIDIGAWKATLRQSLPLLVSAVARATVLAFDLLVIQLLLGPKKVGYYGAALKPVLTILGVFGLLSVTFLSSFSATHGQDAARLFRRTTRAITAVSLPLAVAISAGSFLIVPVIYGGSYSPSVGLLSILAWVLPLSAIGVTYSTVLIARERQTQLMWINLAAGVVNVAGAFIAIPVLGVEGAAVVRILTSLVTLVLMYRVSVGLGLALPISEIVGRPGVQPALQKHR